MSKAIFNFTVKKGFRLNERMEELAGNEDFRNFLIENEDKRLTLTLEDANIKGDKMKLYAFINGPVMYAMSEAMRDLGETMDRADCMLYCKIKFLKDLYTDRQGNVHTIILSQSDVPFNRLLQFTKDVCHHLEEDFGVKVPDSETYIRMKFKNK